MNVKSNWFLRDNISGISDAGREFRILMNSQKGWNVIQGDTQDLFYTVTSVAQTPVEFSVRDYFWPINEKEISINSNLVQNFDW